MLQRAAKNKHATRLYLLLHPPPYSTLVLTPRQGTRGPSSPGSRLLGPPPPLAGPLSAQHRSLSHNEALSSSSTSSALVSTTSRTTLEAITKELARRQAADANNIGSAGGNSGRGRNYSNCSSTGTGGWSVGSSGGDGGSGGVTNARSAQAASVGSATAAEAATSPSAGVGGVDGSSLISENNGNDNVAVGGEKKGGGGGGSEGSGARPTSLPGKSLRTGGLEEAGAEERDDQVAIVVNPSPTVSGYSSNNNGGKNNDKKNQGKDRGPGGLVGLVEGEEEEAEEAEEAAAAAAAAASDHNSDNDSDGNSNNCSSGGRESALEDQFALPFPFEEEEVAPSERSDGALTRPNTGQVEPCSASGTADEASHQASDPAPPGSAREWKYSQATATAIDMVGVGGVARSVLEGTSAMGEEGSLRVKTSSWRGDFRDDSAAAVEAVSMKGSVEDGRSGQRRGCGEDFSRFARTSVVCVCVSCVNSLLLVLWVCLRSSLSYVAHLIHLHSHALNTHTNPATGLGRIRTRTKIKQKRDTAAAAAATGAPASLGEAEQSLPWAAMSAAARRESGARGREFTKREPHEKMRTRSRSHSMAEVGGES